MMMFLDDQLGLSENWAFIVLTQSGKMHMTAFVICITLMGVKRMPALPLPSSHLNYTLVIFLLKSLCSVKERAMDIIEALPLLFFMYLRVSRPPGVYLTAPVVMDGWLKMAMLNLCTPRDLQ